MQFDVNILNGTTIQYVLQLSQRPANPEKLWRGKITATFIHSFIHSDSIEAVQVESLETGYEGCNDLVYLYQIRAIESNA